MPNDDDSEPSARFKDFDDASTISGADLLEHKENGDGRVVKRDYLRPQMRDFADWAFGPGGIATQGAGNGFRILNRRDYRQQMQPNNLGDADRTQTSPKSRTHAIGPSVSDWTHQPSIPLTTEPQFAPIEILLPSHMQQIYRLHPCKSKEMSAATNEKRGGNARRFVAYVV
ncbi:hypothetical protein J7T55_003683 [Diaporthe amygdali]|uniref:uncharacterized protein n=1 Tax=Phomopsis amygdali TaxID=1214568 RepID=UPI0022FE30E6|nr:uncharacterized protein J7T55_003683 [Diaporthe amygdali]KAJ0117272.1 hypothetical protein J7T55_003683 [Diaporthe amygdali]